MRRDEILPGVARACGTQWHRLPCDGTLGGRHVTILPCVGEVRSGRLYRARQCSSVASTPSPD